MNRHQRFHQSFCSVGCYLFASQLRKHCHKCTCYRIRNTFFVQTFKWRNYSLLTSFGTLRKAYSFFIFYYFIFYIYLHIYPPDSQESAVGAIHRVSNYPDLLPEMPKYCCLLEISIAIRLKFRTIFQDRQAEESAVKCLSQGHNRMARVGFEPRPCQSRSQRFNHSTTLPTTLS